MKICPVSETLFNPDRRGGDVTRATIAFRFVNSAKNGNFRNHY